MFTSLKHILFFNLIVFSVISVHSQNTTSDYTSSQLISYGLDAPGRMAIDSNDYIYVLDADKKSIVIYDGSGVYKRQIITDFNPISIAVNKNKQLFVGDEITGNIYLVNTDGSKTLFHSGTKLPNSMVFGFKNILYVTDSEAKEVLGLDVSGNTVLQFSDPNFTFPTGIAFDEKNNRLVVSEHGGIGPETNTYCNQNGGWAVRNYGPNTSIYAFDLNGTLLNQFGCFGMYDGQNHRIQGVSVGPCGNIYAVDPYLARISVYDEFGNFLTHVGQSGNGSGEFNLPIDLLFSSDHRLIVSSMDKASLDIFEIAMPIPSAIIKTTDITTCSASVELEVQFTGTAPWTFTYTLDGLNPTQITTSDNPYMLTASAGFYEITALTDGNLNTTTCFNGGAMVTSSMQPTATVSNTTLDKCTDDGSGIDITFTGIPPYKFTYTINDKNPIEVTTTKQVYTLIPKTSGLYKITSISNDACGGIVNNGIVDVVVNPLPTAEITNGNVRITIPEGGSTELTIALTGTGPWTFVYVIDEKNSTTITTDQSPYMLTASLEGTYEVVQITDAYCTSDISKGYPEVVFGTISEPAVATMETSTINICEGNAATIPIHFTGTAPWIFSYTIDGTPAGEITTSETTYQLMTSTPGVYQLSSVIDALNIPGIFSGSAVVIENPLPMIDLATSYILCEGDSVVLNPGSFESYLWNDNSTNQTLTVYSSGLYSVMVTDINGCTNTTNVEVIVNPLPVLNLGPDIIICEGDSVALNPGNFVSYLWNNGSTNQTLTAYSSGLYSVMVTDENGCTNTASVEVIVNPLPVLDLGPDIVICEGDSAYILDAGLFDSYLWSDGSTGRTLGISSAGIYGVTVTNASGCSTSDFVSVSISTLPDAYFYVNFNTLEVQFVNNSLNADSHYWDFGDGTSSTEENPIHNYASKGTYTVTYTALSNYCGSSVFTETVNVGGKSTSEIIDIYPNPSTGSFTILISPNEPLLGTINILINSTSGQYLYSGTYNPNMVTSYNGNYYIDVNIAQFTKGIYIVYIDAGNFVGQDKLILKD